MSERGKNVNVASFSDTINVVNVKPCLMVLRSELDLFIPLSVTLSVFQGHSCIQQFLTENYMFISDLVETVYDFLLA